MASHDLCIVMDATASMGTFFEALRRTIPQLQDIVRLTGCFGHVGVLTYRDYCDRELTEWSGWHSEPQHLLGFVRELRACGGGDTPEATKTALVKLLEVVKRPTLVLLYTDAPPHSSGTGGDNYAREVQQLGENSDWVVLSRKLAEANIRVCPIVTRGAGINFYGSLAGWTGGVALELAAEPQPSQILQASIATVMRWLGFATTYPTCYRMADENIRSERELLFQGGQRVEFEVLEPVMTTNLVDRFKTEPLYCDLVYTTMASLLTVESVLALTYNPVFGLLWRAVCNRRQDDRRGQLIAQLEDCIRCLPGPDQATLRAWIAESYHNEEEIRGTIAECPTPFPAVVLDLPTRERLTPPDLLEVARSCHPTALARVNRLLTNLRVVESNPGCEYLPLALNDADFWGYLPHLMASGTSFSLRPSVILAMVAIRTQSFLAERAGAFLARVRGKWFDLEAAENYTLDFAKLALSVPQALTESEQEVLGRVAKIGGILINLRTEVEVELPVTPKLQLLPDRKVECRACHQNRSITLMTEIAGQCGCCVQGVTPPEDVEGQQSYLVTCRTCQGLYAVVCRHLLNVVPKCHYCRHGQKVPLVECSGCRNRYVIPRREHREGVFTCAACEHDPQLMRRRVSRPILALLQENSDAILAQLGLKCTSRFTLQMGSIYSIFRYFTSTSTPSEVPRLEVDGLPVHNAAEVLETVRRWVEGGTAERFCCSLCFGEFSRMGELPVCGNMNCHQTACEGCLQGWYGGTAPGNLVLTARLACPFCRRAPKVSILKRHNKRVCELTRNLEPLDPAYYHAWCLKCYRVRPYVEHACAEEEPDPQGAFVCASCSAPAAAAGVETQNCPGCAVTTEKNGGCNHIACPCGTHWCYACGHAFDRDEIYDHMYEKHGGIGL